MSEKNTGSAYISRSCVFLVHTHISSIIIVLLELENKIHEWTSKRPIETWNELIEKLLEQLHPNHYLVFGLKKALIGNPRPSSTTTSIEDLKQKLKHCQEVLEVVTKLGQYLVFSNK